MRISDWSSDVCSSDLQQLGTSNLRILPWKHKLSCPDWTAPPAIKPMKPPSGLHSCRYRKNTKGRKGPWITWLERSSAAAAAFGEKWPWLPIPAFPKQMQKQSQPG